MIIPSKHNKPLSTKNCYIKAIDIFNKLPNELKTLNIQERTSTENYDN